MSSRPALVAEARRMLREKFEAADAGITGANFLAAEEGAAVIVTNEGNGDMTRLLPRVHIVLTGIEKVVADMKDVSVLLRLLTRSATGQEISTYVSVMAGPREPGSTDGPEEFHVVLLDNGRTRLLGTEAEPVLRCIRCAACINHCPVYGSIGGHAYTSTYPGPIGAALNPELVGPSKNDHATASSFCGRCVEVCPVKIPLTTIMRHWRQRAFEAGEAPRARVIGLSLWAFAAKRPGLYRFASSLAARFLKLAAGGNKALRLPFPSGWFLARDLPAPAGETFHARYRRTAK
jgi:L-lactate dehydrogenase complex protein LldF